MANFNCHHLISTDFEKLPADLLSAELGVSFEQFAKGRDGGLDFRHVLDGGKLPSGRLSESKDEHVDSKGLSRVWLVDKVEVVAVYATEIDQ